MSDTNENPNLGQDPSEHRGPEDDLVSEDPDLGLGSDPVVETGPAELDDEPGMADPPTDVPPPGGGADLGVEDANQGGATLGGGDTEEETHGGHPSQAEGEDPADPRDAETLPAEGHPSQAEGEA